MGAAGSLRTTGRGHPVAQVTGVPDKRSNHGDVNMGTTDVRATTRTTQVVTLASLGGGDSFKIQVNYPHPEVDAEETIAFVDGVNATAVAIAAALEDLTGISDVSVSGTTDAGPFTITFETDGDVAMGTNQDPRYRGQGALLALSDLSGCSGHVTMTDPSYIDSTGHAVTAAGASGTNVAANRTASFPGLLAGETVPLGHSVRGAGGGPVYPTPVDLLPLTIDGAIGGSGEVVVTATIDSSGSTALYVVVAADTNTIVDAVSTDADGDVTISSLAAGEYFLLGYAVTATPFRISSPTPREYFTVS